MGAPNATDKSVMLAANKACAGIENEVDFENAVVGYFVIHRHNYIDENYYTVDFGRPDPVRLSRASRDLP